MSAAGCCRSIAAPPRRSSWRICAPRTLKALFAHHAGEIADAGLGESFEEFRRGLAAIRRAGVSVSRGEIDPGRIGVAAPIFDKDRAVLGSLSVALPAAHADDALVRAAGALDDRGRA